MIFPIIDLVPMVCFYLSVRDIRAIACTSRDVHDMIAPFIVVRVEKNVEHLRTMTVIYHKTMWPRLYCDIKHEVEIDYSLFDIKPDRLDIDYSGVLTIMMPITSLASLHNSYIRVRNGLAQYGAGSIRYSSNRSPVRSGYVYAVGVPMPFIYFVDMFINYMRYGDMGNGYIDNVMTGMMYLRMHECRYEHIHHFIWGEEFMKMFVQW